MKPPKIAPPGPPKVVPARTPVPAYPSMAPSVPPFIVPPTRPSLTAPDGEPPQMPSFTSCRAGFMISVLMVYCLIELATATGSGPCCQPLFAAIPNALAVRHRTCTRAPYREAVVVSPEEECPSLDGFGPSMNFPTTERTQSITYESARPIGMVTKAGTHLVVQGTNKINGT